MLRLAWNQHRISIQLITQRPGQFDNTIFVRVGLSRQFFKCRNPPLIADSIQSSYTKQWFACRPT
ncbi:hypothetical protein LZ31DRAFT_95583 [Colletotrichum somersetense]|nr:hypothetical protein LZ31DRAFT_95583 [Colletotrichum somersetense]